jgi:hypothetical protein
MSGASGSDQDMVVGRRNESDDSTSLIAIESPDGYGADYVLKVATALLPLPARGVDAIHAEGNETGNGVVSRGSNGVVGYVRARARDTTLEGSVGAGVLGVGDGASPGVFGSGKNGVVGYEQATSRNVAFENAQSAGVVGCGGATGVSGLGATGVSGLGVNGAGVLGRADTNPGVQGVSTGGPGLLGDGDTGAIAHGVGGPGLIATSRDEQAAVLESARVAQLWLVPLRVIDPKSEIRRSNAGELLVTVGPESQAGDAREVASLWFCRIGGGPGQSDWVKLA